MLDTLLVNLKKKLLTKNIQNTFDFKKINIFKNSFRNTVGVSNSLNPDQDRQYVGPDRGPKCLQRLSADDKSCL